MKQSKHDIFLKFNADTEASASSSKFKYDKVFVSQDREQNKCIKSIN